MGHTDLRAPKRLALLVAQSAAATTAATSPSPPPPPASASPSPPRLLQQHIGISDPRDAGAPLHDVPGRRQSRDSWDSWDQSRPVQLGRQPQQAAVPERVGGVEIALGAEVQVAGEDAKPRPPPSYCSCSTPQPLW